EAAGLLFSMRRVQARKVRDSLSASPEAQMHAILLSTIHRPNEPADLWFLLRRERMPGQVNGLFKCAAQGSGDGPRRDCSAFFWKSPSSALRGTFSRDGRRK